MNDTIPALLFLSDSRKASLYRGSLSSASAAGLPRLRLELAERITSPWTDFHEHGRPAALGRGPSAKSVQHFASEGHERDELERRFAANVAAWIESRAGAAPEAAKVVFADPRFLGHLRRAVEAIRLEASIERGEFSWMRPAELGAHPTIREAFEAARARMATAG
jgi:protein required for attachment to host cells